MRRTSPAQAEAVKAKIISLGFYGENGQLKTNIDGTRETADNAIADSINAQPGGSHIPVDPLMRNELDLFSSVAGVGVGAVDAERFMQALESAAAGTDQQAVFLRRALGWIKGGGINVRDPAVRAWLDILGAAWAADPELPRIVTAIKALGEVAQTWPEAELGRACHHLDIAEADGRFF